MRLINAEEQECWACRNQSENGCITFCDHGESFKIRPEIKYAKTAYNVEAVMKELEKMKPDRECFDDDEEGMEDYLYALKRHNEYIEVVRKGGVK